MPQTIVCIAGPGSTGKSSIIREFTARHLKYKKAKGDVLGIFPMPYRDCAVGVAGGGDNLELVLKRAKVFDPLQEPQSNGLSRVIRGG